MTETPPITVDVVSDVMCPWCYIGKRRLEAALRAVPQLDILVRWHPFQLDATLPKTGKDRQQYLSDKFGGMDRANSFYSQIRAAGQEEGIDFAFDAITLSPNTLDCHRLILWSRDDDLQDEVVERLFKAYFLDGRRPDEVQRNACAGYLTRPACNQIWSNSLLETETDLDKVTAQIENAVEVGCFRCSLLHH